MAFHNKQGQVGMQFNWIFVLIVGGLILGFFFMIVTNQQKKATIEGAQDLIERLDTLFTTIDKQPNAVDSFNIPNAKIEFTCEPGLSNYYIQDVGPIQTAYDVIATQKILEGNKIITWTRTWEVPYEATSITNMANDRTLFVFVNTTTDGASVSAQIMNRLWYELPDEFSKFKVKSSSLIMSDYPKGYDKYVYIFTYDGLVDDFKLTFEQISKSEIADKSVARAIDDSAGVSILDDGVGSIAMYYGTVPIGASLDTRPFLYMPSLWAAIFTENAETYDCTMKKALFKLNVTTQILNKRADMIADELTGTTCVDYFTDAHKNYEQIQKDSSKDLFIALSSIYNVGRGDGLSNTVSLEKLAGVSLRGYNCPYIY